MMSNYHLPVMLQECMDGLQINPSGTYVDVTYGGGGHARAILDRLGEDGTLLVFDQDADAVKNRIDDPRLHFCEANFRYLENFCSYYGIDSVDGILADLGVSSHQFDVAERGFSTRFEADLDMRMNQKSQLSAFHVINEYDEEQLKNVFFQYGELRAAGAMAKVIIEHRKETVIKTSEQLKKVLSKFLPPRHENKVLAQIYQAIRIEVNQEIEVLKEFLEQTPEVLKQGGRLSFISYHSLEDRLVKRFIRNGLFEGEPERDMYGNFEVPLKKINGLIVPSKEEIKRNSRARSAKLRIAEKL